MSVSTTSSQRNNPRTGWIRFLSLIVLAGISSGFYIYASAEHLRIGFPLDDAWIHQTYARNLALEGEWAFIPRQPSGGSTSPLWTLILSAGYLLHQPPFAWAFFLGWILLGILAFQIDNGLRTFFPDEKIKLLLLGFLVVFEFHFVWSAVSGMETLLHAVLILSISLALLKEKPHWFFLGLMTGLSTWVRPDGITLLGPILLTGLLTQKGWKAKIQSTLCVVGGFLILFFPYLYFNYSLSGTLFPTTFYAKQAEYVGWQANTMVDRSVDFLLIFLTGPAILLFPAFLMEIFNSIKKPDWTRLGLMVWIIGYGGLYMMRLPAYQHGRYLIPAMPVYFLFSMMGLIQFLKNARQTGLFAQVIKKAWILSIFLICANFWVLGMRAYVSDVEFIETEMVDTAKWVAENLPEQAVVAAHDIGALGYFDYHPLVDLAGIISPDVIPYMLDNDKLADYLDTKKVTHVVVFPDWYPLLTRDLSVIFSSEGNYAPSIGGSNMTVYVWR